MICIKFANDPSLPSVPISSLLHTMTFVGPISNQYPNEYYPPDDYYPSGNPNDNEEGLIVIDTHRLEGKKRKNEW